MKETEDRGGRKVKESIKTTKLFLVYSPAIALAVTILLATIFLSGTANPGLLVSVYGSLLEASVTITALVSIFISWVIERKINRAWDALDRMRETEWNDDTEKSQCTFDSLKRQYEIRYRQAEVPEDWKRNIKLIYVPCVSVSILTLIFIGYLLNIREIDHIGAAAYILIAA